MVILKEYASQNQGRMTTIRQAELADAEALAHLSERTFRDTFTTKNNPSDVELYCAENFGPEIQQQDILDANCVTLLAEVDGQLVGFAQVRLYAPKECVAAAHPSELHRLYILKEWQGRGVAHKIMSQALSTAAHAGADAIWLGVWEHNPRAIAFYHKHKFKVMGEHIFQFGNDPQRDLVMMAGLDKPLAFNVQQLGNTDIDLMKALLNCFGEAFHEPETYQGNQPDDRYLLDLLGSDTFIAIAALSQEQVIGGLVAYELKKFEQKRSEIYIYDLAVDESYRRQGVATTLIETLKPIAQDRGAWVIFVQADNGDEPAIQLYSKIGTREEVLHFDISIEDNDRANEPK